VGAPAADSTTTATSSPSGGSDGRAEREVGAAEPVELRVRVFGMARRASSSSAASSKGAAAAAAAAGVAASLPPWGTDLAEPQGTFSTRGAAPGAPGVESATDAQVSTFSSSQAP